MNFQPKKIFTPAEARETLPLVKQIVADIIDTGHEVRAAAVMLGDDAEGHPQIEALLDKIQQFSKELEDVGCYYKDWNFSIGLVDFPAVINEKIVFLCWRSDEADIQYYHEIEAGYAGRTPIPESYLQK